MTAVLTQEYYKARRHLIAWSGVLIAFDTIGLDFSRISSDSSSVATAYKVISRPELAPFVISAIVGYMTIRFSIEFLACHVEARQRPIFRLDFYGSILLSLVAMAFFGFSRLGAEAIVSAADNDIRPWAPYVYPTGLVILAIMSFSRAVTGVRNAYVAGQSRELLTESEWFKVQDGYRIEVESSQPTYFLILVVTLGIAPLGAAMTESLIGRFVLVSLALAVPFGSYLAGRAFFRRLPNSLKREMTLDVWKRVGVGSQELGDRPSGGEVPETTPKTGPEPKLGRL